ncbi:MAG TPA: hypothetical protein VIJ59_02830 [Caulobacteraceae bacterium]
MRNLAFAVMLMVSAAPVLAQQSPVAAPPTGVPDANPIPGASSDTTTVTVQPDASATPMADPQSAAEFGSPSAVDSPSSAMPNAAAWPTIRPSAKRPSWVKKAPPSNAPPSTDQPPAAPR